VVFQIFKITIRRRKTKNRRNSIRNKDRKRWRFRRRRSQSILGGRIQTTLQAK